MVEREAWGPTYVVAGALRISEDKWLMHRRPLEKDHGGLWEFPGGKVEDTEIPVKALVRELHEELGIEVSVRDCEPAGFAEERGLSARANGRSPIVIMLYTIADWKGEARALEGGRIERFTPDQIANLDKPPLDQELARRLFGNP
ncbi:NUDIX domain-containing protein [Erythrobacter sp. Alg231-14]|uniref:NUDIX domain-containing protein n=1 Tax=Erythrobacter sp. Alg231-14 TaxID=1922225 RepID=UPI000D54D4E7